MEPFYLTLNLTSPNLLDDLELASICSLRRERPKLKHDRRRPHGDAFFAEKDRISLFDHGDQMSGGLEKGKIGEDIGDIKTGEPADPNIVWWDGDDDPANPLNWSAWSKWMNVGMVAMITFIVWGFRHSIPIYI